MFSEKKISSGLLLSIIATTLGFIAFFFPDLFNSDVHNVEKMEKIEAVINSKDEYLKLVDFLRKRKDGKVFQIDAMFCTNNVSTQQSINSIVKNINIAYVSDHSDLLDKSIFTFEGEYDLSEVEKKHEKVLSERFIFPGDIVYDYTNGKIITEQNCTGYLVNGYAVFNQESQPGGLWYGSVNYRL